MKRYIDADKLKAEIERRKNEWKALFDDGENTAAKECFYEDENILDIITSLHQEQPEVDLKYIENDAELIANKIMIGVQSNRYHTCVYNTERNDFNHSHLVQAARKGIEFGLKTSITLMFAPIVECGI